MSTLKTYYPLVAVVASSLFASAAWAASFQFPHQAHKNACPTAVENVNPSAVVTDEARKAGKEQDSKTKTSGVPVAKMQNGLLLPAVKNGKTQGQQAGDAAKAEAAAAVTGK